MLSKVIVWLTERHDARRHEFRPTGWPQNGTIVLYALTLPNIKLLTDFQNYFAVRIGRIFIIILSPKIPPHLKCVATLPCKMSSVLKVTIENKMTCVTTHFKKVTTRNSVCIASVIAWSNWHILQFLHQMFNVSALLLDDALKPVTLLTNCAISETLRQFAPLTDDKLEMWWDLSDYYYSIITNFLLILTVK